MHAAMMGVRPAQAAPGAGGSAVITRGRRPSNRAVAQRPFPDRPEGSDNLPEIGHVLVLMMENHSYDNYLGMLGRGPGEDPRGDGFATRGSARTLSLHGRARRPVDSGGRRALGRSS
jgi:phospholipase C